MLEEAALFKKCQQCCPNGFTFLVVLVFPRSKVLLFPCMARETEARSGYLAQSCTKDT